MQARTSLVQINGNAAVCTPTWYTVQNHSHTHTHIHTKKNNLWTRHKCIRTESQAQNKQKKYDAVRVWDFYGFRNLSYGSFSGFLSHLIAVARKDKIHRESEMSNNVNWTRCATVGSGRLKSLHLVGHSFLKLTGAFSPSCLSVDCPWVDLDFPIVWNSRVASWVCSWTVYPSALVLGTGTASIQPLWSPHMARTFFFVSTFSPFYTLPSVGAIYSSRLSY